MFRWIYFPMKKSFLNQKTRALEVFGILMGSGFSKKIAGPLLQRMDPFNLPGSIEPLNGPQVRSPKVQQWNSRRKKKITQKQKSRTVLFFLVLDLCNHMFQHLILVFVGKIWWITVFYQKMSSNQSSWGFPTQLLKRWSLVSPDIQVTQLRQLGGRTLQIQTKHGVLDVVVF